MKVIGNKTAELLQYGDVLSAVQLDDLRCDPDYGKGTTFWAELQRCGTVRAGCSHVMVTEVDTSGDWTYVRYATGNGTGNFNIWHELEVQVYGN